MGNAHITARTSVVTRAVGVKGLPIADKYPETSADLGGAIHFRRRLRVW